MSQPSQSEADVPETALTSGEGAAPSRFELTLLYGLLGAHLVIGTDAAIPSGWFPFVWFTLLVIGGLALLRVTQALWTWRSARPPWLPWAELAGILGVLGLIYGTHSVLMIRIFLSEKSLLKQIAIIQEISAESSEESASSAGLFQIRAAYRNPPGESGSEPGMIWLETVTGTRLLKAQDCMWAGLVYSEKGIPPNFGDSSYEHLYGPWWLWVEGI
jgi:hypothetical protein